MQCVDIWSSRPWVKPSRLHVARVAQIVLFMRGRNSRESQATTLPPANALHGFEIGDYLSGQREAAPPRSASLLTVNPNVPRQRRAVSTSVRWTWSRSEARGTTQRPGDRSRGVTT